MVKLFDDDSGIDADDLMGSTRTDSEGRFEISGHADELTPIDPKLNIYTDCNDGPKPCQRKITIKIPNGYITSGKVVKKSYDAGVIQLASSFAGEERDCIH
uniref:Transthyretin-like family protein n=1 Tax=Panagrolaimus sp. ES5 TaxID=591445 RepID=A0AC34F5T6_9BILA